MPQPLTSSPLSWDYQNLSDLLTLDQVEDNQFRNRLHDSNFNGRVFGGQILGQAIAAAMQTVQDRVPTALQLLFLQGGDIQTPIDYAVTPLQDGKRFSSRHLRGIQQERIICDAHVSFQRAPSGLERGEPLMDAVPDPETLHTLTQLQADCANESAEQTFRLHEKPCLSLCLVDPRKHLFETGAAPHVKFWLKLNNPLRETPIDHYAALAYLSDYWMGSSSLTPHVPLAAVRGKLYMASLNHSLWFHSECRADDWLLFVSENVRTAQGRGLVLARVYDRSRRHVATVSQECLMTPAA